MIDITTKQRIRNKYKLLLESCPALLTQHDLPRVKAILERDKSCIMPNELESLLDITLIVTKEIGLGRTSVICSILHKALEMELTTLDEIRTEFGEKIWEIANGLMSISRIYATQQIINSENFRKLLLSFAKDIRVQLIMIAEKLFALRRAGSLDHDAQLALTKETDYIYIPFAHRLGLYNVKSEMEDLSLKYSNPKIYKEIARKLKDTKAAREKYIAEFIAPLKEELDKRGIKYQVKYRTKTIASILNKMRKSQVEFEEIYDIFAVRFIIDSIGEDEKPDCWRVYSVVTDKYTPNPRRLRDWISVPKSNGYESLQTTVLGPGKRWVEVQIRTERMDDVAEKGFAAHWKYKGGSADHAVENWLNELREILENSTNNTLELLDDMKIELQDKEVHVFTPKGDLVTLQAGATLLDFAYSIHTNVGNHCMGGKVNDRNETLRYVLKNGDQVSIFTSANQQPKADWLNFTITSKARNKIRSLLNEEVNKQADVGKELLMRRLKNWKIEVTDELIHKLMQRYKYKFALDFYQGIASGKHDLADIKEFLIQPKDEERATTTQQRDIKVNETKAISEDVLLIDKNVTNVEYKFAKCCNPVYGDEIMGFVSIGEGIKVHRKECKNALELTKRYPYRVVKTQWTNEGATSYSAVLRIAGKDVGGVINKITEVISKTPKVLLRGVSINTGDGAFYGELNVSVNNTDMLMQLINRIKQIDGVERVNRHNSMLEQ
ncbi:MAG: RelA/SpoT family protein [Marinifilaceae bacterium]